MISTRLRRRWTIRNLKRLDLQKRDQQKQRERKNVMIRSCQVTTSGIRDKCSLALAQLQPDLLANCFHFVLSTQWTDFCTDVWLLWRNNEVNTRCRICRSFWGWRRVAGGRGPSPEFSGGTGLRRCRWGPGCAVGRCRPETPALPPRGTHPPAAMWDTWSHAVLETSARDRNRSRKARCDRSCPGAKLGSAAWANLAKERKMCDQAGQLRDPNGTVREKPDIYHKGATKNTIFFLGITVRPRV